MIDERATILQTISDQAYGISDLIKKLRLRSEKVVSLLRAMESEGLIDFLETNNPTVKGRPKKIPIVTALGKKMIKDYVKCKRNIIQINDNDIRSSIHQVSLRRALEEKNISPYRRFFELNEIAFRIKKPSLIECLRKLVKVFEGQNIEYMFIGGLALPAYGEIRATQDIDVAVVVTDLQTLERLFNELAKKSFEQTAEPTLEAACIYVLDRKNMVDVKIWLKPDGIKFDKELLTRRQRREMPGMEVWVVGPEDFIVNKLSRADRRARDESDVVSVLIGQRGKLDREYLEKRANEFGVFSLLQVLEDKVKKD